MGLLAITLLMALNEPTTAQNQDPDEALRRQMQLRLLQQKDAQLQQQLLQQQLLQLQLQRDVQLQRMDVLLRLDGAQGAQLLQAEITRARALAQAGAIQPAWTDERLEAVVFSPVGNAVEARHRLESQLTLFVDSLDRTCKLTADQKAKLRLTGRGDIKRYFNGFESIKAKFHATNNDVARLEDLLPEITVLQLVLNTGLFQDDSLVFKSLRNTLNDEQFERYDAGIRERLAAQHRLVVQRVIAFIEQGSPMHFDRRNELITLFTKSTKPPRKHSPQYDMYVVAYQVGKLPDEKLRPLLDDVQWRNLKRLADQSQALEPAMRQQGLLPEDAPGK
jgi:hypothetical protein